MSDVFDEIISKLKQKAKSDAEIKRCMHLTEEQMQMICKLPPEELQNYFDKLSEETKWVRLEDVLSILQQLKQNYVITKKDKSTLEDCPHAPEIMQYICLICDKTVYYRRLSSEEEAITKNEG